MLTQLIPEQISKFWPIIKYAVEESLPPTVGEHPERMNRVLAAALSGKLDVWVSYKREQNKFEAILVTQILYEHVTNTRSVLLYALYAYEKSEPDSWAEGWEAITKYAKSKNCSSIVAYSANPKVIEMAKVYKANTDYTFITFNI